MIHTNEFNTILNCEVISAWEKEFFTKMGPQGQNKGSDKVEPSLSIDEEIDEELIKRRIFNILQDAEVARMEMADAVNITD